LKDGERDIIRELDYYFVVKELIKLGPQGMETLLTKLRFVNIPILEMVGEVHKVRDFCKGEVYKIANVLSRDTILLKEQQIGYNHYYTPMLYSYNYDIIITKNLLRQGT
jgi:hypothetical protein